MSLRGGRSLPDEAIFSNVLEDCFAPAGLAMTKGAMTIGAMTKGAMTGVSDHETTKKSGVL
jgi:hypothetical protein